MSFSGAGTGQLQEASTVCGQSEEPASWTGPDGSPVIANTHHAIEDWQNPPTEAGLLRSKKDDQLRSTPTAPNTQVKRSHKRTARSDTGPKDSPASEIQHPTSH